MNETVTLRNKGARIKEYTIDYPKKFNSLEDAERYIDMLRERYNFKVFEFNDKESGHWFE